MQEQISVYWDERKEMYAATLDSTNQVFYDVTEAENFDVFIKNAVLRPPWQCEQSARSRCAGQKLKHPQ